MGLDIPDSYAAITPEVLVLLQARRIGMGKFAQQSISVLGRFPSMRLSLVFLIHRNCVSDSNRVWYCRQRLQRSWCVLVAVLLRPHISDGGGCQDRPRLFPVFRLIAIPELAAHVTCVSSPFKNVPANDGGRWDILSIRKKY